MSGGVFLLPSRLMANHTELNKSKKGLPLPVFNRQQSFSILKSVDLSPAKWIWYPMERCLSNTVVLFRKVVTLSAVPKKATGYVLADSRYKLSLNGQRIQWGPAPCDPRKMEADPLNLSESFVRGENIIACSVLYFGLGDGTSPIGKPGFLFKLNIEMDDGSVIQIVSDDSWQSCLPRSWQPGHYKRWFLRSFQEEFDARRYPYGWDNAGYVPDRNWLQAKVYSSGGDKPSVCSWLAEYQWAISASFDDCCIRERSIPMMEESVVKGFKLHESAWIKWERPAEEYFESMTPNAFVFEWSNPAREIGPGEWEISVSKERAAVLTFELYEQMVGWPDFTVIAPEGTIIEVMVHEAHAHHGPVLLNSHFNSWTRFICREGENHFETFDFESYRWIQFHIRNYNQPVILKHLVVRRRKYPWKEEPQIICNDTVIQRLMNASINTLYNCAQETLVDGMARERQQYSGDGGHLLHAIFYTFGDIRLPARFVNTFGQGQGLDGVFMDSWPGFDRLARVMERQMQLTGWGPILDHSVGFCFDSWHYYLYTGQTDALEETYPRLLRFFKYLQSITGEDGLLPVENLGLPSVWIDHHAYKKQKHKQCALNLYVAAMCQHALSRLCHVFANDDWSNEISVYGKQLEQACIKKYWDEKRKVFVCNLPWSAEEKEILYCDRSLATSIIFDQCPGAETGSAIKILAEAPPEMGLSYPCNAIWRYWALVRGRAIQVVIDELRNRWGKMDSVIENNTLQEHWVVKPDSNDQWSHCPVSPLVMLYQGIGGIHPLQPGFAKCLIDPQPGDLDKISFHAHTVSGTIRFELSGEKNNRKLALSVPENMDCEILLDKREKVELSAGTVQRASGQSAYKLPNGKTVKLQLKYL